LRRKIVIIVASLVRESAEEPNEKIEKEILEELRERPIPWTEKAEKVTVLELDYENQ